MLHALGFPDDQMPQLLVHGWWNLSGAKISKSAGNVIDPFALIDKYGAEALRYYLMSDIFAGKDADFAEDRLASRYSNDLANSLGNLLNRTLSMTHKYREGRLDKSFETEPLFLRPAGWWNSETAADSSSRNTAYLAAQLWTTSGLADVMYSKFSPVMSGFAVHEAIGSVNHWNKLGNELVEIASPWKLAKDPARKSELDATLYHLAESLRIVAILMSIVIAESRAWNFRSTELEDGVERKGRTVSS